MRITRWTLAVVAASSVALVWAPAASAHNSHGGKPFTPKVLTTEVFAPFHLAANGGRLYVADGGTSTVSRINKDGSLKTLATGPQPGEVAGVALSKSGKSLAYTTTDYTTGATTLTIKTGSKTVVADLSGYEAAHNPDAINHYGLADPSCAGDVLGDLASYTGIVESHPYAVERWNGVWVVADAAANALWRVDDRGRVSTLAVLPPQPLVITQEFAEANGVPDCVGQTYAFEPVPTDVAVGKDGKLYVTTLPGGPEDPSAGARGSVYRVNPWTGHSKRIATGFAGATSLTFGKDGTLYVAELFTGQVSKVKHGCPSKVASLPGVVSVEYGNGHLYAGTLAPTDDEGNPTGPGSVVKLR